ncbi:hypothetical protein Gotur_023956 [Gossypium turneri]
MARLPLIAQSVRRKRIGIALTIWLQICRIACWFLLTLGVSHSLHTYRPRIRSYILDFYAKRDHVKRLIFYDCDANVSLDDVDVSATEPQPDRYQWGSSSSKKKKKRILLQVIIFLLQFMMLPLYLQKTCGPLANKSVGVLPPMW